MIHKQIIQPGEDTTIPGYPLSFHWQPGVGFCVWYVANDQQTWTVATVATGEPAPGYTGTDFLGTAIQSIPTAKPWPARTFVLHAFRIET